MATAEAVPKAVFEQLENAVLFSTSDKLPVNDTIYVNITEGNLVTVGRGRYCACIDSRPLAEGSGEGYVILDPQEVSEVVSAAKKVKGFGGKTARVRLDLDETGLVLTLGPERFTMNRSELADDVDSDDEHEGIYDALFRTAEASTTWMVPTRMVILRHMMKMLDKIKHGEPSREEDPFSFMVRPEGTWGNGIATCRVGPVRVYQVVAEVD